ncbi:MAG TPA: helix-turn-helix transcriptional regulator [Polyangia bacterium]|nr:helix-turn-helix transcriptional regulator [Polyangia bacterium]
MPRRTKPDALSLAIGARIRQLREEAGLTMEQLAFESELGSKGHLSNIERGLVRPTAHTLSLLSERLGVELGDMVTFPEAASERGRLYDLTRRMAGSRVRLLLHEAEEIVARTPRLRAAEGTSGYRKHRRRTPAATD